MYMLLPFAGTGLFVSKPLSICRAPWKVLGVPSQPRVSQAMTAASPGKEEEPTKPRVGFLTEAAAAVEGRSSGSPAAAARTHRLTMALFSLMFMVLFSRASELSWPSSRESSSDSEAESSLSFSCLQLVFLPRITFLLSCKRDPGNRGSAEPFLSAFFASFLVGNWKATRRPILLLLGLLLRAVAFSSSSSSSPLTKDSLPSSLKSDSTS